MNENSSPVVRLSCQQCSRRKTKCDRQSPCSACKIAGIACQEVKRSRKPRGKSGLQGKRNHELHTKVSQLENLVKQLQAHIQPTDTHSVLNSDTAGSLTSPSSPQPVSKVPEYVAPWFWQALSEEVSGIRDILEEDDVSENVESGSTSTVEQQTSDTSSSMRMLFSHGSSSNHHIAPILSNDSHQLLLDIYQQRVDAIFSVGDWPTMRYSIESSGTDSDKLALQSCIYFSAICTLTEDECMGMFQLTKDALLVQYQANAEEFISRSRFLQKPNLITLQAFILYLTGLRASSGSASGWALLAIAVRIARGIGLDTLEGTQGSADIRKIRKRLWYSIGVLDTQLALDRGSLPLLYAEDFSSTSVDITELSITNTQLPQVCQEWSFSSMTHEAMLCEKAVYAHPAKSQDNWADWNKKIAAIEQFENSVKTKCCDINASSSPLERLKKSVAEGAVANIKLMLRRPPYKSNHTKIPPWDDFDVMKATTDILESALEKQYAEEYTPWIWFRWVKWYALAVLLAELCSRGNDPSSEKAYLITKRSYENIAPVVADDDSGMLWKPIAKLMRRVDSLRGGDASPASNLMSDFMFNHPMWEGGGGNILNPNPLFYSGAQNELSADMSTNTSSTTSAAYGNSFDNTPDYTFQQDVTFDDQLMWWNLFTNEVNGMQ